MKGNIIKKFLLFCMCLAASLFLSGQITAYAYGGSGTSADPYTTNSYSELRTFLGSTKDGVYIKLSGDVRVSDTQSGNNLTVAKGSKYIDLNGYNIVRNTSANDPYLFIVEYLGALTITNTNLAKESTIRVVNSDYCTGVIRGDEGSNIILGNARGDKITLDYSRNNSATPCPTIENNGNLYCHKGVTVKGYNWSLYSNNSKAYLLIDGGNFVWGINIQQALFSRIEGAELGSGSPNQYALIAPKGTVGSDCVISQNGATVNLVTITGTYGTLECINRNNTTTTIKPGVAPNISKQPTSQTVTADGSDSATFTCYAPYATGFTWGVIDTSSATMVNAYSWEDVSDHCSYSGVSTNELKLTPYAGDTWLNGKKVYCTVTNEYGSTLTNQVYIYVNMPKITSIIITGIDKPYVGKTPDTSCTLYNANYYNIRASIVWYRFNSNGIGTVMSSGETFNSTDTYGARIYVASIGDYLFDTKTDYDEYGYDYNAFAGTVTVNGETPYSAIVEADDTQVRILYLWGEKAQSDHTHSWRTKVVIPASYDANGLLQKVCTCGATMDLGDLGVIPRIAKGSLSAYSYVYDTTEMNPAISFTTSRGTTIDPAYYTVTIPAGRIAVGTYTYNITFKDYYTGTDTLSFTIVPAQTKNLKTSNTSTGIKVSWDAAPGAGGYYLYRSDDGGSSYTRIKTVSGLTYTDPDAKTNGKKYAYKVVSYKKVDDVTYKGKTSSVKAQYYVSRPTISSLTSTTATKALVKWNKNSSATGYQIQYSLKSDFSSGNKTVTITSNSTVSKTLTGLTSKKKYYVRIRSYKTVSDVKYYSAYSATKYITVK